MTKSTNLLSSESGKFLFPHGDLEVAGGNVQLPELATDPVTKLFVDPILPEAKFDEIIPNQVPSTSMPMDEMWREAWAIIVQFTGIGSFFNKQPLGEVTEQQFYSAKSPLFEERGIHGLGSNAFGHRASLEFPELAHNLPLPPEGRPGFTEPATTSAFIWNSPLSSESWYELLHRSYDFVLESFGLAVTNLIHRPVIAPTDPCSLIGGETWTDLCSTLPSYALSQGLENVGSVPPFVMGVLSSLQFLQPLSLGFFICIVRYYFVDKYSWRASVCGHLVAHIFVFCLAFFGCTRALWLFDFLSPWLPIAGILMLVDVIAIYKGNVKRTPRGKLKKKKLKVFSTPYQRFLGKEAYPDENYPFKFSWPRTRCLRRWFLWSFSFALTLDSVIGIQDVFLTPTPPLFHGMTGILQISGLVLGILIPSLVFIALMEPILDQFRIVTQKLFYEQVKAHTAKVRLVTKPDVDTPELWSDAQLDYTYLLWFVSMAICIGMATLTIPWRAFEPVNFKGLGLASPTSSVMLRTYGPSKREWLPALSDATVLMFPEDIVHDWLGGPVKQNKNDTSAVGNEEWMVPRPYFDQWGETVRDCPESFIWEPDIWQRRSEKINRYFIDDLDPARWAGEVGEYAALREEELFRAEEEWERKTMRLDVDRYAQDSLASLDPSRTGRDADKAADEQVEDKLGQFLSENAQKQAENTGGERLDIDSSFRLQKLGLRPMRVHALDKPKEHEPRPFTSWQALQYQRISDADIHTLMTHVEKGSMGSVMWSQIEEIMRWVPQLPRAYKSTEPRSALFTPDGSLRINLWPDKHWHSTEKAKKATETFILGVKINEESNKKKLEPVPEQFSSYKHFNKKRYAPEGIDDTIRMMRPHTFFTRPYEGTWTGLDNEQVPDFKEYRMEEFRGFDDPFCSVTREANDFKSLLYKNPVTKWSIKVLADRLISNSYPYQIGDKLSVIAREYAHESLVYYHNSLRNYHASVWSAGVQAHGLSPTKTVYHQPYRHQGAGTLASARRLVFTNRNEFENLDANPVAEFGQVLPSYGSGPLLHEELQNHVTAKSLRKPGWETWQHKVKAENPVSPYYFDTGMSFYPVFLSWDKESHRFVLTPVQFHSPDGLSTGSSSHNPTTKSPKGGGSEKSPSV